MKKLIILILVFLTVSELNAISTDEYNRDVYGHDRDGGHTVSRHVNKSFINLRARCKGVKSKRTYTSYRNASDASYTLRSMFINRLNRERINLFQKVKGIGISKKLPIASRIKRKRSFFFRKSGLGTGIDCSRLGEVRKKRKWFWRYIKKLDEYNYLRTATATLGYNHPKRRWYVQTSFPTLKKK